VVCVLAAVGFSIVFGYIMCVLLVMNLACCVMLWRKLLLVCGVRRMRIRATHCTYYMTKELIENRRDSQQLI
jgi:hypothetical protein